MHRLSTASVGRDALGKNVRLGSDVHGEHDHCHPLVSRNDSALGGHAVLAAELFQHIHLFSGARNCEPEVLHAGLGSRGVHADGSLQAGAGDRVIAQGLDLRSARLS